MAERSDRQRAVDNLLARSIARWSVVVALLILAFDLAIIEGYPFPLDSRGVRGAFYGAAGIALLIAAAVSTFLGWRIVTLRFVPRTASVYLIFLPLVAIIGSVLGLLFLAAPA